MSRRKPKPIYWQDAPMAREQLVLFSASLESRIPPDHPVRIVDEIMDRMDWKSWEAGYDPRRIGQPPIHPSVLAKVLLFAMIRRLRSSRQIEYSLKHSIDFMWLTHGREIDHSTISAFRRKHTAALKDLFKQMVGVAIDLKIANLAEVCIDGTRILASSHRFKTWTTERLQKFLTEIEKQIEEALGSLEANDQIENDLYGEEIQADRLPENIADLQERRDQLEALLAKTKEMDENRLLHRMKGPAQLPKTDIDSRILPNKEGGYAPNYTPMAVTETQGGFIVDAEVVIGNVEHNQLEPSLDRIHENFSVKVEQVLADKAYTTGENLETTSEQNITLIGPLAEVDRSNNPAERADLTQPVAAEDLNRLPKNPTTGRFDRAAFIYDEQRNSYFCPAGRELTHRSSINTTYKGNKPILRHIYKSVSCRDCPLAHLCRKNPQSQKPKELNDESFEVLRRAHRQRMKTELAQAAYKRRSHIGETPFAVIKGLFGLRRFLLRSHQNVSQEWRWAATAFNLLRLMKHWRSCCAPTQKNEVSMAS